MANKTLIVVGAGDFGREVLQWARATLAANDWKIGGFIDDNMEALPKNHEFRVLAKIKDFMPKNDQVLAMGIADPRSKLDVASFLQEKGAEFVSIIHPTALVGDQVSLGVGTVLCPYAVISLGARIGSFVSVNLHTTIGHDTVVGDGCTFSSHNDLGGFVELGRGVFLGSHATVIPKIKVGDYARIGAGSAVYRNVKPGSTVVGVPAKALL